ncbi:hypothetical protein BE15_02845 [Sorangium cellulosum]|uniref:Uncharacterized protein n=1 Tax=Sorangium cellulosum TaxID=56 RepID=A0A150Q6J0_SORCE|nr:hypothetical protein BE15_02845 [Sorangium cellulosum]
MRCSGELAGADRRGKLFRDRIAHATPRRGARRAPGGDPARHEVIAPMLRRAGRLFACAVLSGGPGCTERPRAEPGQAAEQLLTRRKRPLGSAR